MTPVGTARRGDDGAMVISDADAASDGKTGQFSYEQLARAATQDVPCVVVVVGPQMGRVIDIPVGRAFLGRAPTNDIVLAADGVSRRHASLERERGGVRLRDLGSTNGVFVGGVRADDRVLKHGDIATIGAVSLRFVEAGSLERDQYRYLYETSVRDPLTGVYNRGHFDESLALEVARAHRHSRDLSLLLIDIDHFKLVNDTWGHPCGDAVLRALPGVASSALRATDLLARYGGEEFAVVLPETGRAGAEAAAERVRERVERHPFAVGTDVLHITVSIGAAAWSRDDPTPERLVEAADRNLYEAKRTGRNRVVA